QELAALETLLTAPARPTVLLTGHGGVGKTRLALEAARRARTANSPTTILCVRSRGTDAGADLRAAIERPGRYIVMIDDANRLLNLAGVLEVVLEPQPDREVRVLLTVRDYMADGVRQLLQERGETEVLGIAPLGDEELRELLVRSFGIHNYKYQRRIQ